jgi:outer membrane protein insertion porin family
MQEGTLTHRPVPAVLALGLTLCVGAESGQALPGSRLRLVDISLQGGTADDQAFARLALGLRVGMDVDPGALDALLEAVRATDRFVAVAGRYTQVGGGLGLALTLDPLPRCRSVRWEGLPTELRRLIPSDLRANTVLGPRRTARAMAQVEQGLREWGYPQGRVTLSRPDGDVVFQVQPGPPDLIRAFQVVGDPGPYPEAALLKTMGLVLGRTLWHETFRLEAQVSLRRRFLKDDRLEGHAELRWQPGTGTLVVDLHAGPKVSLALEGGGLGLSSLRNLVPLARADVYTPDLLDEGDRRLLRFLRNDGHLDAEVGHRREILKGSPGQPEEVRLTYVLRPGSSYVLSDVRIEGNLELPLAELEESVALPRSWLLLGNASATPDLISGLEDRIRTTYWNRGYPDVDVRRQPLEKRGNQATAVFTIREGPRRLVHALELDLPPAAFPDPKSLAACLPSYFLDRPDPSPPRSLEPRTYRSDRRGGQGQSGSLVERVQPSSDRRTFTFTFAPAVPLVKADLARVLDQLRRRMMAQGILRPQWKVQMQGPEEGTTLQIELLPQPSALIQRVVVQGADRTRARAIQQESVLEPGAPLDPDRLVRTQSAWANLGGFDRVDLMAMQEDPQSRREPPWQDGDLLARMQERSPWVISHAFGYDKSQGYHVGLGVQRLNVGGMGRTLDLGIRAGDGTLRNPTLRNLFPTGPQPRSVDMYSLGYSDPWFTSVGSWLPDRTLYRVEGAYVLEQRDTYLIRRRRVQNSLEWRVGGAVQLQAGLRFEQVRVESNIEGITDEELNATTRIPGRATISAPYLQVIRDLRDNPMDPTDGSYFLARVEMANQLWGTSANSSFVKLDLRQQWHWPFGFRAEAGVASLGLRLGAARPTASTARDLPLSERFFAGGPFTHRGVEPDWLGPQGGVPVRDTFAPYTQHVDAQGRPIFQPVPLGGQGLVLINAEYRFPVFKRSIWGEVFVDSGMVYRTFTPDPGETRYPPLRTAIGLGLILKLGMPIKIEYAVDLKRILGKSRTEEERGTQLKNVLLSAGFQF